MNFAVILAGGTGSRMNNANIPKQFIDLCGEPIIVHTIKKILETEEFDYLYVAVHPEYKKYLEKILDKFNLKKQKITLINGGKERIDSILNAINAIYQFNHNNDDIVVIHDAVRPFVTKRILKESIDAASKYGACVAVVPAIDTMYTLDFDKNISGLTERKTLFNGQSPDSFKLGVLRNSINSLTDEEKEKITGTVQICASKGIKVKTIKGEYQNIKITTEYDLKLAEVIIANGNITNESLCTVR